MCKIEQLLKLLKDIFFGVVARERGHGLVARAPAVRTLTTTSLRWSED
jgi:hypothetical protein